MIRPILLLASAACLLIALILDLSESTWTDMDAWFIGGILAFVLSFLVEPATVYVKSTRTQ